jgi:putative YphP/YqiW family bacilliredoxin
MRQALTRLGVQAAGRARPGMALALKHPMVPDPVATVCAGGDLAATARVRAPLQDYPPSSPAVVLFCDGQTVFMWQRHQIEQRDATEIATALTEAFDRCWGQPPEEKRSSVSRPACSCLRAAMAPSRAPSGCP